MSKTPHPPRGLRLRELDSLSLEEDEGDLGYQGVAVLRDDLMVVRMHGHAQSGEVTDRVSGHLREALQGAHKAWVFFDLEDFRGYQPAVRVRYTDGIRSNLAGVEAVIVFGTAKVVKMGATIASMVIPQLRSVDRSEFDRLFANQLRGGR